MSQIEYEDFDPNLKIFVFVLCALFFYSILREIEKKTGIPHRLAMIATGMVLGYYSDHLGRYGEAIQLVYKADKGPVMGLILLPVACFMGNFVCDLYQFKKEIVPGLIISIPGMLLNMTMICFIFYFLLGYNNFNFWEVFNLGAMIAPASPGDFQDKLIAIGASRKFYNIFSYEANFASGLGIFLCKQVLKFDQMQEDQARWLSLLYFFGYLFFSLLLGTCAALIFSNTLRLCKNDQLMVNIAIFLCMSLTAYFCNYVTNPLGGFSLGLTMLGLGLLMSVLGRVHINKSKDYINLLILFVSSYITRFFSLLVFYPYIKNLGYGMNMKKLCLLVVGHEKTLIWFFILWSTPNLHYYQYTFFFASFFYVLCQTVNFILQTNTVIYKFGVVEQSVYKQNVMLMINKKMIENQKKKLDMLKLTKEYNLADWDLVNEMAGIEKLNIKVPKFSYEYQLSQQRYNAIIQLRNSAFKKLSDHLSSIKSYRDIEYACQLALDSSEEPINIFEIIQKRNATQLSLKFLYSLRDVRFISQFVRKYINNHIAQVYEVCITTAGCLRETIHSLSKFKLFQETVFENKLNPEKYREIQHVLIQEFAQEMRKIDDYIQELYYTYTSILKSIQTRLGAVMITNFAISFIGKQRKRNIISGEDYRKYTKFFNKKQETMNIMNYDIDLPQAEAFGLAFPLIQRLSESELQILRTNMKKMKFQKGETIFAYNQKQEYFYLVEQGICQEKLSKETTLTKPVGHFIGSMNVLNDQMSITSAKAQTDVTVQAFDISMVKKVFKINKSFKQKFYRKLIYTSCQTHINKAGILGELEEIDMKLITKGGFLKKIKKNHTLNIQYGAYVFEGQISDKNGFVYTNYYFIPPVQYYEECLSNMKPFKQGQYEESYQKLHSQFQPNNPFSPIFFIQEDSLIYLFREYDYQFLFNELNAALRNTRLSYANYGINLTQDMEQQMRMTYAQKQTSMQKASKKKQKKRINYPNQKGYWVQDSGNIEQGENIDAGGNFSVIDQQIEDDERDMQDLQAQLQYPFESQGSSYHTFERNSICEDLDNAIYDWETQKDEKQKVVGNYYKVINEDVQVKQPSGRSFKSQASRQFSQRYSKNF
ncbi:Cyclic nucleotide-binding protein [Pseudocohnilembus persalinus]|uniref:Cyclic nucleotide-binding protein n=1 Tax=Pseudocohnilembus persalinus TaxID=266149 RepID=A0A0V0R654_PSEPJ|nr:Cyclic nucleotide-binding protein [Pseudocohnilembus persalinus]|eukprot:KRX09701.1 Cyclic nucleotide-binding protein [Pseudocohnilembus persalinus]